MSVDTTLLPGHEKRFNLDDWNVLDNEYEQITQAARKAIAHELLGKDPPSLYDVIHRAVNAGMAAAMAATFKGNEYPNTVRVDFPWRMRGRPRKVQPLDLYVTLPFGEDDTCEPTFKVSMRELVNDVMDGWCELDENGEGRINVSEKSRPHLERFVEALEAEAAHCRKLLAEARLVDDKTGFEIINGAISSG